MASAALVIYIYTVYMDVKQRKESNANFVKFNIKMFTKSIKTKLITKTWFQYDGIALLSPVLTMNVFFIYIVIYMYLKTEKQY